MGVSTIIVTMSGEADTAKKVRLTIPEGGYVSFGYVSLPAASIEALAKLKMAWPGDRPCFRSLQIFDAAEKLLASIPQATSFRYTDVNFTEEVTKEVGSTIWSSDQNGYERTESLKRTEMFAEEEASRRLLEAKESLKRPRR